MARTTRYAVLTGPRRVEIMEMEVPAPGPGDLIVRVTHAGVCGTDTHRYVGELGFDPIQLGHEGVGVVEEMGPGADVDSMGREVTLGDLVFWAPAPPCRRCHACSVEGDLSACQQRRWPLPPGTPGAATFSQRVLLAAGTTFARVTPGTPPEAVVALGCALPSALQGLERLGPITPDDRVVVLGCGPVGIASTWLTARTGADVVVVGGPAPRRTLIQQFGARATVPLETLGPEARHDAVIESLGGRRPTVVIEAAGQAAAFAEALDLVGVGGRILVLGLWANQGSCTIAPNVINNKNLAVIGSQFCQPRHYLRAVELVEEAHDRLPLAQAVTARFPLAQCASALDAVIEGDVVKAVISPSDDLDEAGARRGTLER